MRHSAVLALVANVLLPAVLAWSIPETAGSVLAHVQEALGTPEHQSVEGNQVADEEEAFDGHQVWRIEMEGMESGETEVVRDVIGLLDLDIWRNGQSSLDVRIPPHQLEPFRALLPAQSNLTLFVPNISSLLYTAPMHPSLRTEDWDVSTLDTPFHEHYHPITDIYRFIDQLASAFNGKAIDDGKLHVEAFSVGKTFEGKEIKGLRSKWVPNVIPPTHTAKPKPLPTQTDTMTETGTSTSSAGSFEESDVTGQSKSKKGKKGKGHKGHNHGKDKGKKGKGKKKQIEREFVIQSGSHAREWIGPSSAIYFIHSLLLAGTADTESEQAQLLKAFTFSVVPTINPDGYEYSREHRMWRKNRQEVGSRSCSGIDLNSNWGYKWQKPARSNPCSDAYPGKKAFEAYETKAMANYLNEGVAWAHEEMEGKKKGKGKGPERKVRAFVDLHSYGQLFMFPFAHSCDDFPPDAEMLLEAALGVAKAMRAGHGETYQTGQACELTYRAPGDAIDYAYGTSDVRWSYSAELRDTGTYGFLLPPSLIRPAADEITTGLVHLAKFIYNVEVVN